MLLPHGKFSQSVFCLTAGLDAELSTIPCNNDVINTKTRTLLIIHINSELTGMFLLLIICASVGRSAGSAPGRVVLSIGSFWTNLYCLKMPHVTFSLKTI